MNREELIEEAAKAIEKVPYHAWHDVTREGARVIARAALAAFEAAHAKELDTSPGRVKNEADSSQVGAAQKPTDARVKADAKEHAAERYSGVIYLSEYNAAVSAFVEGAMWRAEDVRVAESDHP